MGDVILPVRQLKYQVWQLDSQNNIRRTFRWHFRNAKGSLWWSHYEVVCVFNWYKGFKGGRGGFKNDGRFFRSLLDEKKNGKVATLFTRFGAVWLFIFSEIRRLDFLWDNFVIRSRKKLMKAYLWCLISNKYEYVMNLYVVNLSSHLLLMSP